MAKSVKASAEQVQKNIELVKEVNRLRKTEGLKVKEACVRLGLSPYTYNYYQFSKLKKESTPKKKVSLALAKRPIEHQTIIFPVSDKNRDKENNAHGQSDKVVFFMGSSSAVESLKEILTTLINR